MAFCITFLKRSDDRMNSLFKIRCMVLGRYADPFSI
jgi:hypothetical protein